MAIRITDHASDSYKCVCGQEAVLHCWGGNGRAYICNCGRITEHERQAAIVQPQDVARWKRRLCRCGGQALSGDTRGDGHRDIWHYWECSQCGLRVYESNGGGLDEALAEWERCHQDEDVYYRALGRRIAMLASMGYRERRVARKEGLDD